MLCESNVGLETRDLFRVKSQVEVARLGPSRPLRESPWDVKEPVGIEIAREQAECSLFFFFLSLFHAYGCFVCMRVCLCAICMPSA